MAPIPARQHPSTPTPLLSQQQHHEHALASMQQRVVRTGPRARAKQPSIRSLAHALASRLPQQSGRAGLLLNKLRVASRGVWWVGLGKVLLCSALLERMRSAVHQNGVSVRAGAVLSPLQSPQRCQRPAEVRTLPVLARSIYPISSSRGQRSIRACKHQDDGSSG